MLQCTLTNQLVREVDLSWEADILDYHRPYNSLAKCPQDSFCQTSRNITCHIHQVNFPKCTVTYHILIKFLTLTDMVNEKIISEKLQPQHFNLIAKQT